MASAGLVAPAAPAALAHLRAQPIHWVGAWERPGTTSIAEDGALVGARQSFQMLVYPGISGSTVRIRLSNAFGRTPLRFEDVVVARPQGDAAVAPLAPGSAHTAYLGGHDHRRRPARGASSTPTPSRCV